MLVKQCELYSVTSKLTNLWRNFSKTLRYANPARRIRIFSLRPKYSHWCRTCLLSQSPRKIRSFKWYLVKRNDGLISEGIFNLYCCLSSFQLNGKSFWAIFGEANFSPDTYFLKILRRSIYVLALANLAWSPFWKVGF